jgi:hypothetical protein
MATKSKTKAELEAEIAQLKAEAIDKEALAKKIYNRGRQENLCEDGLKEFIENELGVEMDGGYHLFVILAKAASGDDNGIKEVKEDILWSGLSATEWVAICIDNSDLDLPATPTSDWIKRNVIGSKLSFDAKEF